MGSCPPGVTLQCDPRDDWADGLVTIQDEPHRAGNVCYTKVPLTDGQGIPQPEQNMNGTVSPVTEQGPSVGPDSN